MEKNTALSISGADKVVVGDFCATIRRQREPEPYKGKGIRCDVRVRQASVRAMHSLHVCKGIAMGHGLVCMGECNWLYSRSFDLQFLVDQVKVHFSHMIQAPTAKSLKQNMGATACMLVMYSSLLLAVVVQYLSQEVTSFDNEITEAQHRHYREPECDVFPHS